MQSKNYIRIFTKTSRQEGWSCRGVGHGIMGGVCSVGSEAVAGDAAAGDLVGGEGVVVLIGEVEEAIDLCGLLEPVDEGCHFGVDGVGRASEADIDDDEGHIKDSEVAFGTFPQTELDVSAVVEIIVDTGTDRVSSRLRHRRRS